MFIGEFIETTPVRKWGKQDWAEEKLNCNVGATETSVHSYPKVRQRGQGFVALHWMLTGTGQGV